jgi:hypothetical protein
MFQIAAPDRGGDGYTPAVERIGFRLRSSLVIAVLILAASGIAHAAEVTVLNPSGAPVGWQTWLDEHAPVAVILWASWVPEASATIHEMAALAGAARDRGLELVLISVQEDAEEVRLDLENSNIDWLNDRYGDLLKHYRVVKIPALLVIGEDGRVAARLDATAEALRAWNSD